MIERAIEIVIAAVAATTLTVGPVTSGVEHPRPEGVPTNTPAPTATVAPPTATAEVQALTWPTQRQLTRSEMVSLLRHVGWPVWSIPGALSVSWCESEWKPWATGNAGERGLFQVHPAYHADATYDPVGNARAALRIWTSDGGSFIQWTCQP